LLDISRIERAIADAERCTSGEIRVSVAPFFWGSVDGAARKAFDRLGMASTRHRNGVLLFLVPARRCFVILGDTAIHDRVSQDFWNRAAEIVSGHFRKGDFTEGIVRGIGMVGEQLARHFPRDAADENELPDAVDRGP
jgi:uncharacterized membrane protein